MGEGFSLECLQPSFIPSQGRLLALALPSFKGQLLLMQMYAQGQLS